MRSLFSKLCIICIAILLIGLFFGLRSNNDSVNDKRPIIGNAQKLKNSYENWKARATKNGADNKITLGLGYDKALSYKFTGASGEASLDLMNGAFSVQVSGLNEKENYDVWLIDNIEGPKKSVKPEKGDVIVKIGTLTNDDGSLKLYNQIEPKKFNNFKLDLVAVTPAGKKPLDSGLIYGAPSLFQRLYYSELRGEFANLNNKPTGSTQRSLLSTPFRVIIPEPAFAKNDKTTNGDLNQLELLVHQGEELFFEESFGGNGRTCGTCHPFENNFTVDKDFIDTLLPDDPLFVAENIPALANLENPTLMREFGLILENLDGFTNPGVMRGVPHTLGLPTSLRQDTSIANPPVDMTGWSGDGAPAPGGIRNFATGAVIQHFPKTLNRVAGVDFVLPDDHELDAMEAFQLSLGRQFDPDLPGGVDQEPVGIELALIDTPAQQGCVIMQNGNKPPFGNSTKGGRCAACHNNAGALNAQSENRNFITGVEDLIEDPDVSTGEPRPRDAGFGQDPSTAGIGGNSGNCAIAPGGFGNNNFNTPSIIESVDTPPFFHNNAVAGTIEDAIRFFNSEEFNNNCLNDAPGNPGASLGREIGGEIELTEEEITKVGKCARVLNSLDNIRNSNEFLVDARSNSRFGINEKIQKLRLSLFDIDDAIEVLSEKGLHPSSVTDLEQAVHFIETAIDTNSTKARNALIDDAIEELDSARGAMCTPGSDPALCP